MFKTYLICAALSILLNACTPSEVDIAWFQGEWISDGSATKSIESTLPASPSMGNLIWSIDNRMIYATDHSIDAEYDVSFTIEGATTEGFRLLTSQDKFLSTRTDFGFCIEPFGIPSSQITIECFVSTGGI